MTVVENPLKDAKVAYEYYELPGELVDIQPLGNGLINKTYMYCKRLIIIFFQMYVD